MNQDNSQLLRLIRWNRCWLVLVVSCVSIGGYKYLEHHIISNAFRLQLTWGDSETAKDERALIFSSAAGGPFVVTHLMTQAGGDIDTATAAIAELPRPLFVRGPKARTYISGRELDKLIWLEADGRRAAVPKADAPIQALYYEPQKVATAK